MKRFSAAMIFLLALSAAEAREGAVEISWDDLMPEGEEAPPPLFGHAGTIFELEPATQPGNYEVNADIIGRRVELSGFAVPLELEDGKVSRLLLVPYFGACIHLPPPPPNQIVDVTLGKPTAIPGLDTVIVARGLLKAEQVETELAGAAYVLAEASVKRAKERRR